MIMAQESQSQVSFEPAKEPKVMQRVRSVGKSEVILLIEDEEALRSLIRYLLEDEGYGVLTAPDGSEALRLYRTYHSEIDLLLMDLGVPGPSGIDLLLRLKSLNPQAKIIVSSGNLDTGLRGELKSAGACGFIAKPFLAEAALCSIRAALVGQQ